MKNTKCFLSILVIASLALPSFAQNNPAEEPNHLGAKLSAAIQRAAQKALKQKQNAGRLDIGGEPASGPFFIAISSKNGQNGEPETQYFYIRSASSCETNGGEPACDCYEEIDVAVFNQAKQLWEQDKQAHNGRAVRSLHDYYNQVQKAISANRCVRCGDKVRPGQHCKAADYNALCTARLEGETSASTSHNPYFKGGDPHNAANYEKCRLCGEPITDENLHRKCPKDQDVYCTPATASEEKSAVCFRCGEPITDENLNRKCPKDVDAYCTPAVKSYAKTVTCYRCGKSFRAGQHCKAAGYNAFCAATPEQERALQQAAQEAQQADDSVCPKCGKQYTLDERYHDVAHNCKK